MNFDEKNIILSFAAISDTHITGKKDADDSEKKFKNALRILRRTSSENGRPLDLILIVGDLIDRSWEEPKMQISAFADMLRSEDTAPIFYCLGDGHDLFWSDENNRDMASLFYRIIGEKNISFDNNGETLFEISHTVFKGYTFISLMPCSRGPICYSEQTKQKLREILDSTDKERYVFIITHPMIHDTCYGSTLGDIWDTDDITDILSSHPNVVIFGGHLHFPLNDERSVMQTAFTSVGCGSVRYMAIESGGYENMTGKTTMRDSYRFSQGDLCEIDKNGAFRITRIDFYNDGIIKEPWILEPPQKDLSHLKRYGKDRANIAVAPYFEEGFFARVENSGEDTRITFPAAKDNDMVHHYNVNVCAKYICKDIKILSDFYRHSQVCDMAKEISFLLGRPYSSNDKICIKVTAVNSWGKESETVFAECFV